jgi:hypothetical protein
VNTTDHPEDEAEHTLRYWRAAISSLATPEKRAVAEEFLRRKLEAGCGADTLFALIILLEANGAFLFKLPEKLNVEFAQPVIEHLEGLENALITHQDRQKGALGEFDKVQQAIADAASLIEESRRELGVKVRTAVACLDAAAIADSVGSVLEGNILRLLKLSLEGLDKSTEQAVRASQAAEQTAQTWRKIHARGTLLTSMVCSALLAGCVLCWGWWTMENRYRTRLAAQITRLDSTDDAYRQLLWLGVSIHLAPREDSSGRTVPDEYTMTIDHAETATVQTSELGSKAAVVLKAKPLFKRVDAFTKDVRKLEADLQEATRKTR